MRLNDLAHILRAQAELDHYKRLVLQHPNAPAYLHRLRDAEVRIYELLRLRTETISETIDDRNGVRRIFN